MPPMQFTVNVVWSQGAGQVLVNPETVRAGLAGGNGLEAQITWVPTNGTFPSDAFAWKGTPNPGWDPTPDGRNLVSPVFDPQGEPSWFYEISIIDSGGTRRTKDPEIQNQEPPLGEGEDKNKPKPPGQQGGGQPGQPGGGQPGGGQRGGSDTGTEDKE